MNREQRRAAVKNLKSKGISEIIAKQFIAAQEKFRMGEPIPEGTKVKLNIKSLLSDVDYERKTPKYKKFIEDHTDEVFTVEYIPELTDRPTVVCLKEDPSEVKWTWWVGDLEIVNEEKQVNQ
jgi:hypothetical protein